MKKTIFKFPTESEYHKFIKYIVLKDCVNNAENLTVECHADETEKRVAIEIFNAEIVE